MQRSRFHPLPGLGVVTLRGPDALSFLQGQVTADLRLIAPGHSSAAAWCSPQGRVIALLQVTPLDDGLLCVLPRELAGPVAARMARFVMRAKVTIADESGALAVTGVTDADEALQGPAAGNVALRLPAGRSLLVAPADRQEALAGAGSTGTEAAWESLCVALGEPAVYAATSESWVPQMLNLDLLGAVSFSKGCYPGQEIVARTQNLGRIKRRLFRYRVSGDTLPAPGQALCLGQARVGEVVRAARDQGSAMLLAVVGLESAGVGLTLEDGAAACSPEPLPYAVPEAAAAP